MDTQVVVALISGVFTAVVTPLVTEVIIPRFTKPAQPPLIPKTRTLRPYLQSALAGLGGAIIGYLFIGPIVDRPCPPFSPTKVTITAPLPGNSVSRLVSIQGTACRLPNNEELWILIVPDGVTAYYPQESPVLVAEDGSWITSAYIGQDIPADVGRGFTLSAALADTSGSAAIRTYFSQSGPDFLGLEPLPQGVRLLAQVSVVRK